jgi:hypothetical protein
MCALRRLLRGVLFGALPAVRWTVRLILHSQHQEDFLSMATKQAM